MKSVRALIICEGKPCAQMSGAGVRGKWELGFWSLLDWPQASGILVWRTDVITFLGIDVQVLPHLLSSPLYRSHLYLPSPPRSLAFFYISHITFSESPSDCPHVKSSLSLPSVSIWPLTIFLFVGWLAPVSGSAVARKSYVGK